MTQGLAIVPYNPVAGNFRKAGQALADFTGRNRGAIGLGGAALTGLGVLSGAAQSLQNPEESKLSNVAGAAGNAAGGLGGWLAGSAMGGLAGARLGAAGGPWGAALGGLLGATVGSGALENIARAGVSLYEDPTAKEFRRIEKQRAMEREQATLDFQARFPLELEAAAAKAQIEQAMLAKQAEIQNQRDMQAGLIQAGLMRTHGQKAQDLALTQGIMSSIFG